VTTVRTPCADQKLHTPKTRNKLTAATGTENSAYYRTTNNKWTTVTKTTPRARPKICKIQHVKTKVRESTAADSICTGKNCTAPATQSQPAQS
jgi:hypothetical protein